MGIWIRAWWVCFWYSLTQLFTGFGGRYIMWAGYPVEIANRLSYGHKYRPDRPAGAMTHPRKVQRRIDDGARVGDCEDHAGYWCAALTISKLAKTTYLGGVFYKKDGKKLGHIVCVYETPDGVHLWADYVAPRSLETRDEWVQSVFASYGETFRYAYLLEAKLIKGGRLRLRPVKVYPCNKG